MKRDRAPAATERFAVELAAKIPRCSTGASARCRASAAQFRALRAHGVRAQHADLVVHVAYDGDPPYRALGGVLLRGRFHDAVERDPVVPDRDTNAIAGYHIVAQ